MIGRSVFQHFLEMGKVVITYIPLEVGNHVAEGSKWTAMIEGLTIVRHNQDEIAGRCPSPVFQSLDWVGDMLQGVRGENELVL